MLSWVKFNGRKFIQWIIILMKGGSGPIIIINKMITKVFKLLKLLFLYNLQNAIKIKLTWNLKIDWYLTMYFKINFIVIYLDNYIYKLKIHSSLFSYKNYFIIYNSSFLLFLFHRRYYYIYLIIIFLTYHKSIGYYIYEEKISMEKKTKYTYIPSLIYYLNNVF